MYTDQKTYNEQTIDYYTGEINPNPAYGQNTWTVFPAVYGHIWRYEGYSDLAISCSCESSIDVSMGYRTELGKGQAKAEGYVQWAADYMKFIYFHWVFHDTPPNYYRWEPYWNTGLFSSSNPFVYQTKAICFLTPYGMIGDNTFLTVRGGVNFHVQVNTVWGIGVKNVLAPGIYSLAAYKDFPVDSVEVWLFQDYDIIGGVYFGRHHVTNENTRVNLGSTLDTISISNLRPATEEEQTYWDYIKSLYP
jgi:hypothetical protein